MAGQTSRRRRGFDIEDGREEPPPAQAGVHRRGAGRRPVQRRVEDRRRRSARSRGARSSRTAPRRWPTGPIPWVCGNCTAPKFGAGGSGRGGAVSADVPVGHDNAARSRRTRSGRLAVAALPPAARSPARSRMPSTAWPVPPTTRSRDERAALADARRPARAPGSRRAAATILARRAGRPGLRLGLQDRELRRRIDGTPMTPAAASTCERSRSPTDPARAAMPVAGAASAGLAAHGPPRGRRGAAEERSRADALASCFTGRSSARRTGRSRERARPRRGARRPAEPTPARASPRSSIIARAATTRSWPSCSDSPVAERRRDVRRAGRARARRAADARDRRSSATSAGRASSATCFTACQLASVLLFAALGLAVTFGLLGVINMAHGEMLMLGAYSTYAVQTIFQCTAGRFGWYLARRDPGGVPRRRRWWASSSSAA